MTNVNNQTANTRWTAAAPRNLFPPAPGIRIGAGINPPQAPAQGAVQKFTQLIKDEKQHLSGKIDSAKTKFAEWKQDRAETARQSKCGRLDAADAKACGGAKTPAFGAKDTLKGFQGTDAQISHNISNWMNQIETKAKNEGVSVSDAKSDLIKDTLVKASAFAFGEIDASALGALATKFEKEGRTEKADFLKDFVATLQTARTPNGARAMFLSEAKAYIADPNANEGTFLRGTGSDGAAAIKKLINVNAGSGYSKAVASELRTSVFDRPDVKSFAKEYAAEMEIQSKIPSEQQTGITGTLARRFTDLAIEIVGHASNVEVPSETKATLAELKNEIVARNDDKVTPFSRTLFSDQLWLKGGSGALMGELQDAFSKGKISKDEYKLATDVIAFVNKFASGTNDAKTLDAGKASLYLAMKDQQIARFDAFFADNGL